MTQAAICALSPRLGFDWQRFERSVASLRMTSAERSG